MPSPGDTICGELYLESLAPTALGAEVFQPVFVARDQARDERLWLTVVDSTFTPTSVDLSTFMAGANGLLGIRHPALVRVVLVDREEDYCVVGYEVLPGAEPLGDLIVRGGARRLLARAAIEVARGLAHLHRRELLHGALTPGTVLLWEGVPVLWEYGLSALCVPESFGPQARSLGGDVVAPEVPQGRALTPMVDVFAWGAVMASIASGELGSEAVAAVLDGDVDPGRHGALLGVVRQALAVEPERRPRDGVHLLEMLQRALASVDPAVEGGESSGPASGELEELARRYLAEMAEAGSASRSIPPPPSVGPSPAEGSGALGRIALTKRSVGIVEERSPKAPWLGASPPRDSTTRPPPGRSPTIPPDAGSPLRQGEATDLGPLPPSTAESGAPSAELDEPEWGHYRLPSGTYAAIRDAPQPEGDGAVRGPEPGVSGADAGVLRLDPAADTSASSWASRAPEVSASAWLRPAPLKAADGGVGGLFDPNQWLRELPHGVRKRWVLSEGSAPRPPDELPQGVPALGTGAPSAIEDDITPSEAILLDGSPAAEPGGYDEVEAPEPFERDTPSDPEGNPLPARTRDVVPDELPPVPDARAPLLPPEPSGSSPLPPSRSRVQEPFRAPRLPGPHGPPAALMTVVLVLLGAALAVGATLSASAARGGLAGLWTSEASSETPDQAGAAAGDAPMADDAPAKGPCPEGMVELSVEDGPLCIDRAEYPGIDQAPATEVDLAHARQACEARGHRLCTEAEWARACRGSAGWRFPYGPEREAGRCRVGDAGANPGPAGADPHCITPEGVLDLVGNVAEWTEDGVVLGGSVRSKKTTSCASRQRIKASAKRPAVGFRCCFDPAEAEAEPESATAADG